MFCIFVNMFFVRNLLFLTSLAFISWLILCYLNHINESRELSHKMDLLDNSLRAMPMCEPKYRGYYGYINFICVFTGIYIMARFIDMIETYFVPNFRSAFERFRRARIASARARARASASASASGSAINMGSKNSEPNNRNGISISIPILALDMHKATLGVDDYRKITVSLRKEIAKMWKRNRFLDQRVNELEQHNLLLMGKGLLLAREASISFVKNARGHNDDDPKMQSVDNSNVNIDPYRYVLERGNGDTGISVGCSKFICTYFCDQNTENNKKNNNANGADGDKGDHQISLNDEIVRVVPLPGHWCPFRPNIFVANRFIHFNGQNDGNMGESTKLGIQSNNTGEFTQIWQKYLRMSQYFRGGLISNERKYDVMNNFPLIVETNTTTTTANTTPTLKKIDPTKIVVDFSAELPKVFETIETNVGLNVKEGLRNPTPIVVTTEDLETIQGLGRPVEIL